MKKTKPAPKGPTWTGRAFDPPGPARVAVRCVWSTRLIVGPPAIAVSQRYEFQPGQTGMVDADDAAIMIAMRKPQPGCCDKPPAPDLKYFEYV